MECLKSAPGALVNKTLLFNNPNPNFSPFSLILILIYSFIEQQIMKEDDNNWLEPDRVSLQELEIVMGNEHISFTTSKIGSLVDVQSSADPEGLRISCWCSKHISFTTSMIVVFFIFLGRWFLKEEEEEREKGKRRVEDEEKEKKKLCVEGSP